jgi:cytochrome c oxidase subunit IV
MSTAPGSKSPMDADHAHAPDSEDQVHVDWRTYRWVALILFAMTVVEVWVYYIPAFVATPLFVPTILILMALKFAIVVLFYMHLKYDNKLFSALFTGPLTIAALILISLLFLFGHLAIHAG